MEWVLRDNVRFDEIRMLKLLLLLSAFMGLPLIFGERTACVESLPQPIEQVWSAADESLWDQIATGKLGLIRDYQGGGHLRFSKKRAKTCLGKVVPIAEISAIYEQQDKTLRTQIQDTNQMCQFQIELTRGHKLKDTFAYRSVLFNSGLRLTDVNGGAKPQQGSTTLNIESMETCDTLYSVIYNLVPGRIIYENAGPRPPVVEMIDPATVPEGQIVYGPGSQTP
jgi:hypothetical protein